MIEFVFLNRLITQVPDNFKRDNLTSEEMLPIPRDFKFKGKFLTFSRLFDLVINGRFTPQETLPKRGNFPSIPEPDWNLNDFSSRIGGWLKQLAFENSDSEIEVIVSKINDQIQNIDEEKLKINVPENARSEAYWLKIEKDRISLKGWTKRGLYYGIITLSQLIQLENNLIILPECEIIDYPDYDIRGLVDDISRGQRPTIENFKKFIDFMSSVKLNTFCLYIEDMFVFQKYPQIGKNRAPLTRELIKKLEEYAMERFIEIQPGFECLGHQENMLLIPEFQKYAEFPGAQCFDISSQDARDFVEDLLSEICPAFSSKAFHLICDESHDCGLGKSQPLFKQIGKAEALAEWYLFLVRTTKKYGKEYPTIAHDVIYKFPKTLELVQGEIPLIVYWNYSDKKRYPIISKLKKKGFSIAGLPGVFDWSRHYPYYDFAMKNMINMAVDGLERGLIGHITTKWGDFFNENFRENIYLGLAIEAQASWNAHASEGKKIFKGFEKIFFGTVDTGIMKITDTLNKQNDELPRFPNGMFNRYWMDPYCREIVPKREYPLALRLINESAEILKKVQLFKQKNTLERNLDNLDYLEFASRMALHYGIKLLASDAAFKIQFNLLDGLNEKLTPLMELGLIPRENLPQKINSFKELSLYFKWLSIDITEKREIYRNLWLRMAEPEGSEYPLRRFEILNWHYKKSIELLENNIKPHAHQLKSEWIWCSGRKWSYNWGNQQWFYFFNSFNLDKKVKRARIQAIANTHLKIHVNQQYVGEVLSRNALSQLPMANSVKIFEITNQLIDKENIVCIEGINWARGIGGINALIHLEYEDGSIQDILTDSSWIYWKKKPSGWPFKSNPSKLQIKGGKRVKSFGAPPNGWNGPITEPIWEMNWISEISFGFGMRNFAETAIASFVPDKLYKALFWLVSIGIKIMGVDILGFRTNH